MRFPTQILLACFILFCTPRLLHAQADKGMTFWEKDDPAAAEVAFRADVDDPKIAPYALYGLALVFSDDQFERRQLDTAFHYIESCDRAYRKMPPNFKSKIVKKLTQTMIGDLRRKIMTQALARAAEQDSPEAYDFFLENYPKPAAKLKKQALTERNALAYRQAETAGTRQALDSLLTRYGASLAADSPALHQQAQKLLFERYLQEQGPGSYDAFKAEYPDNIVSRDTTKAALDRALLGADAAALAVFAETHSNSPFSTLAIDSLNARLLAAGSGSERLKFVRKYPDHPGTNALWRQYYLDIKASAVAPTELEKFRRDHPDFPFQEQLEADLDDLNRNQERYAYEAFERKPDAAAGFRFLQRYPASRYKDAVRNRIAETLTAPEADRADIEEFLKRFPTHERASALLNHLYSLVSEDLDVKQILAFERKYPDFAGKARIAADKERADWSKTDLGAYTDERRADFEMLIRKTAPSEQAFDALRKMIDKDFRNGAYSAAAVTVKAFATAFGKANARYTELAVMLSAQTEDINRSRFAPLINTRAEEYAPILSADGRSLYLCRRGTGGEDIWVSHQDANGNWPAPQPVAAWNTPDKGEAPESISADGNVFFLFRSGSLYLSQKTAQGWSEPQRLGAPFNRFKWQADLSIAADGKAMLFAASESLFGQKDIYVSLLQPDGAWGEPFPLEAPANTPKDDRSPFIHPDGKTLYFSSAGHAGLGSLDIFMTKRLDDSWKNWSQPVNLGPAINTAGDDWGFRVSTDGQFAYYNANIDGNSDIMRCNLPTALRPEEVATITGKITDMAGKPLDAEILWENLQTGEVVQVTRSDPKTGDFFAVLPERTRYGYSVRKPGYFPLSGNVDLRTDLGQIRLDKPMELATIEEMKSRDISLPLNNLFFETAKYDIQPESYPELNRLAQLLISEQLSIEIHGHTDNVGGDAINLSLSKNRADAVRSYLIGQGCDAARITAQGFGKSRPKATNDTEAGRALNRRVEIKIRTE
ncbi:MAG: PD40 domain-containing protein [Saprospiraceae bacterium]|nr:PD40 domain-containing protein [Saprospiraceae bacterium]